MAVPKHKVIKSKTRSRKAANMKLRTPDLVECANCGNRVLPHRICPKCGFYKGKQVFEPEDMA
ncbi:MAG: 50S ribosomal protein L32 [Spirochaetales bacterium]|nr:50S ribosomal protein L32 [Spirochaetales bacterium]